MSVSIRKGCAALGHLARFSLRDLVAVSFFTVATRKLRASYLACLTPGGTFLRHLSATSFPNLYFLRTFILLFSCFCLVICIYLF